MVHNKKHVSLKEFARSGAPFIDHPLDYKELDRICDDLKAGNGISWGDAHKICYYLVKTTRLFLENEFNKDQTYVAFNYYKEFHDNNLNGACRFAAGFACELAKRLNIHSKYIHTEYIECALQKYDMKYHAFARIALPIKPSQTGKASDHVFIIDPTFKQFFRPSNFFDGLLPKDYLTQSFARKSTAQHILNYGFVHGGRTIEADYIQSFYSRSGFFINRRKINYQSPSDFQATKALVFKIDHIDGPTVVMPKAFDEHIIRYPSDINIDTISVISSLLHEICQEHDLELYTKKIIVKKPCLPALKSEPKGLNR